MIKYVLCTVGGAGIGYFVATLVLEKKYEQKLHKEEDELRTFYRQRYVDDAVENGENEGVVLSAVDAAEAVKNYQGLNVPPAVLQDEMTATVKRAVDRGDLEIASPAEVFAKIEKAPEPEDPIGDDGTGFEFTGIRGLLTPEENAQTTEIKPPRRQGVPKPPRINYNAISTPPKAEKAKEPEADPEPKGDGEEVEVDIIDKDAFIADQFGYKQHTVVYYTVDDVLVNSSDEVVSPMNRDVAVGPGTLQKLAEGDEDVMYVRNRTCEWEFEIIREQSKYADEVSSG